jgi:UDP-glucose 4-epimerase
MRLSNQYLNEILERRSGGVATWYAKYVLDFEAKLVLVGICCDSWHWQSKNPNGYNK